MATKKNIPVPSDNMTETTIELTVRLTKVIPTERDAAKAQLAGDRAVRAILGKLTNCDQIQVISDKRFPDLYGDK